MGKEAKASVGVHFTPPAGRRRGRRGGRKPAMRRSQPDGGRPPMLFVQGRGRVEQGRASLRGGPRSRALGPL